MSLKRTSYAALALSVSCGFVTPCQAEATFTGLGALTGYSNVFRSWGLGVSPDGGTAVGWSKSNYNGDAPLNKSEAFTWTEGAGIVGLGELPGGDITSEAYGVSVNGTAVVGYGRSDQVDTFEAFRWTQTGGMVGLGHLSGGSFDYSRANAVSADGDTVVGWSGSDFGGSGSGAEAFVWTPTGGMVGLGDLPGGGTNSLGYDTSADGGVVVGYSYSGNSTSEAFRWTAGGGMVGLGDLPGGAFVSEARGVSADGQVVVGSSLTDQGYEAFRWTASGGMQGLGELPGGEFGSQAYATSANGGVVVGTSNGAVTDFEAFIWDAEHGMRPLQSILEGLGLAAELAGWQLGVAYDISYDGRTIVGQGINPDGEEEGWIAFIPQEGDLSGDGFVGIDDLNLILGGWNQSVPVGDPLLDPSGDGFVGIDDLNYVLGNWNGGVPPIYEVTNDIPEPGMAVLFAVGLCGCVRRR